MILLAAAALAQDSELVVGSYGRVDVATTPTGGAADPAQFVAHGSRLDADPYLELDLGWRIRTADGPTFTALVTPAVSGPLFHYDGTFDASLAIRNLYAEAAGLGRSHVALWAGSRMYRGDDVYLLDFWPLDNLNTVGGGARWSDEQTTIAVHGGLNRLAGGEWQVQQVEDTTPGAVSAQSVTVLDRQRVVASLNGSHIFHLGDVAFRPKVAGEYHHIASGERVVEEGIDAATVEALPAETGGMLGAELSLWGWSEDSFVHLFYRHATGIAAIGEATVPDTGFAVDGSVHAAREDVWALAANEQAGAWSVTAGAYVRSWKDADGNEVDVEDGWEWSGAMRGGAYFARYWTVQGELSHQWLRPNGLNARTDSVEVPEVTRLSVLPAVQVRSGAFARPQIHLRYTLSILNQDAVDFYDHKTPAVSAR